jgi:hypothetical protein
MPRTYWLVAALNLRTSSAGTRPRSFTSMPCALAHSRTSVVFNPLAGPLRSPRAGRPTGATADPPPSPHVGRQRVPQLLGMLGVQVDLVLRAVQPEADRTLCGAAVQVVDEQGLHFLSPRLLHSSL